MSFVSIRNGTTTSKFSYDLFLDVVSCSLCRLNFLPFYGCFTTASAPTWIWDWTGEPNVSDNESERDGSRCREGEGSSLGFKAIAWRVLWALSYLDGTIIVSCLNTHFSDVLEVDIAVLFTAIKPSDVLCCSWGCRKAVPTWRRYKLSKIRVW